MPWPSQAGLLDELEARRVPVEMRPEHEREREVDERRQQRHGARAMSPRAIRMTSTPISGRKVMMLRGRCAHHLNPPTTINQVASATTPISIAKAY